MYLFLFFWGRVVGNTTNPPPSCLRYINWKLSRLVWFERRPKFDSSKTPPTALFAGNSSYLSRTSQASAVDWRLTEAVTPIKNQGSLWRVVSLSTLPLLFFFGFKVFTWQMGAASKWASSSHVGGVKGEIWEQVSFFKSFFRPFSSFLRDLFSFFSFCWDLFRFLCFRCFSLKFTS